MDKRYLVKLFSIEKFSTIIVEVDAEDEEQAEELTLTRYPKWQVDSVILKEINDGQERDE